MSKDNLWVEILSDNDKWSSVQKRSNSGQWHYERRVRFGPQIDPENGEITATERLPYRTIIGELALRCEYPLQITSRLS